MGQESKGKPDRNVPIFIDGEKYDAPEGQMTATALLSLVDKAPAEWYVVLRHGREQTEFRGDELVPIKSGNHYLTVSTGPTPVS